MWTIGVFALYFISIKGKYGAGGQYVYSADYPCRLAFNPPHVHLAKRSFVGTVLPSNRLS